jgi:hypothetical protein
MLIDDINALLSLYGEKIAQDIRTRMAEDGTVATGASNASLEYGVEGATLRVTGNEGIAVVSEGRPAGKQFPNINNLKRWIAIKGLKPNKPNIRPRDLAYVIANAIATNGSLALKKFGYKGSGLLDYVINKNNETLTQDLADLGLEYLDTQLVGQFTKSKDIQIR